MTRVVREPAVAGSFYPDSPSVLARTIDALLAGAGPSARRAPPKALLVPHAGYVYSGPIAASAYALLARSSGVERAIVIGPSHRVFLRGVAGAGASAFATPLGAVTVDVDALRAANLVDRPDAHAREHSLEVQLPFLQRVLPGVPIVPLVVGHASPDEIGPILELLWGGPETVVIVSSDLSHYLPYDEGRRLDAVTADRIVALDGRPLAPEDACGSTAINALAWVARRRGMSAALLDLRSSGDTAGSRAEVVGYGAFSFDEVSRG